MLSKIALSFENLNDFDVDINKALQEVGTFINVSRIYIFFNENGKITRNTFEWCNEGIIPEIHNLQDIEDEVIPSWDIMMKNDGYICSNDITDLPEDIVDILKPQEIKSVVIYPLLIEEEIRGFIGFDECRNKRVWKEEELEILSTLSGLIASVYQRKFIHKALTESEINFRNFFETMEDILIISDLKGRIIHGNKALIDKLKYSLLELKSMSVIELHPEDKREDASIIVQKIINGETDCCPLQIESKFGNIYSVETKIQFGKWNNQDCVYSISKDVTIENENLQLLSKIFDSNPMPMIISTIDENRFIKVNEAFLEKTGYLEEEIIGKTMEELNNIYDYKNMEIIKNKLLNKEKLKDEEFLLRCKDGSTLNCLLSIEQISSQSKQSLLTVIVDVTERVEYEKKILELSNKDPLTNIYNRRYIYNMGEKIIEEYKRMGSLFSVCIIDIDNFKYINDNFGHQIGDFVLKEFTKVVDKNLRPYDLLGRYGGEEFIIILKNTNEKESIIVIDRINKAVKEKSFIYNEEIINITISAGISNSKEISKEEIKLEDLIRIADRRMYIAKNDGKDKIVYKSQKPPL